MELNIPTHTKAKTVAKTQKKKQHISEEEKSKLWEIFDTDHNVECLYTKPVYN